MADEITASATLSASKNGVSMVCSHGAQIDMSGSTAPRLQMVATTTATAIPFTGITGVPRKVQIANLDTTNFVQVDSSTAMDSGFAQKIYPGDFVSLNPQTGTIYALADTASCLLDYGAVQ